VGHGSQAFTVGPVVRVGDMAGLLRELGLEKIKDRGKEVWASCPSHHDSGDSWSINKVTGFHSCFGCPLKGDLMGLILEEMPDSTARKAVALIEKYGVELMKAEEFEELLEDPYRPKIPLVFSPKLRFEKFVDPPVLALQARNIDLEAANHYQVRWQDPNTWIFPIKSPGGMLLGWEEKEETYGHGRGRVKSLPVGVPKSKTLFGVEHLPTDYLIILVESPLDAVRLERIGYPAVAAYGSSVRDDQLRILASGAQEIILCLDNDAAGMEWTWNILSRKINWAAHVRLKVVEYGDREEKDIGGMESVDVVNLIMDAPYCLDWMRDNVHRKPAPISRGGRGKDGKPKTATSYGTNGLGQNRHYHRGYRASS
jgi:CHC2 zinc finger/Toprim-like